MAYCPQCQTPYPSPPAEERPALGRTWDADADDARNEYRARLIGPPLVLALAFLAYGTDGGRAFFRVFLSMWLHELGHAVSAWMCGHAAVPGPWRTAIPEARSPVFVALVLALLGYGAFRAWHSERRGLAYGLGAVALAVIGLCLGLDATRARATITFFGDGGGMVLGAGLMASFYVPTGHHLQKTWLRWGFLVIGAFGFMDPWREWLRARYDADAIAYGEIDGVGASDPSKLVGDYGWSESVMISRYVWLGVICLAILVAVHGYSLYRAWRAHRAAG
jgi:hypothetical protein